MPPRIERILLIQLRRLGDVVLSTALLDDLHRALPDASIDMLVGRHAAPLVAGHPLLRNRIVLEELGTLGTARRVRAAGYDAAVSYTHLRAHETGRNLVCRLLLEKKK